MDRLNCREISKKLAERSEQVARYLLPAGKKVSAEWRCGSVKGELGESLGVHLYGEKAGVFCDFATGESGDLLDLWRLNRSISIIEAFSEATRYLGIAQPNFEAYTPKKFVMPTLQTSSPLTSASPVMRYLISERKLSPETITAFNIQERSRNIVFPYWRKGELIFVKYISLDRDAKGKKKVLTEKDCEPCLFGWDLLPKNSRKIVLTEGEIDAMSLYQYGFPALSVPFGGGTGNKHAWLEYEFDRLALFDEIYLCFDSDEEGKNAVADLIERIGRHRSKIVQLPYKDANECLQKALTKEEIQKYFDEAKTLDPDELKNANSFMNEVIDLFYPADGIEIGIRAPWAKTYGKILFRPEELSIITGINGHGKSQLLGHIILSSMQQGSKVCIASLELKPKRLLMRLTKQAAGLAQPTPGYINAIHDWYSDKLWLFDLVGTAKADRLLEVFTYARRRYGIDVFVIDSLMKLDIAEDDYKAQKALLEKLCDFKNQHGCHIFLIAHPRKGSDESTPPGKLDFKGTGAITDMADNCFSVWRNKKKEEVKRLQEQNLSLSEAQLKELQRPDCYFICNKNRNGDYEGVFYLWFDAVSFQYLESEHHKPIQYVEYSCLNQPTNL